MPLKAAYQFKRKGAGNMVVKIIIGVLIVAAIAVFAYKIDNPKK